MKLVFLASCADEVQVDVPDECREILCGCADLLIVDYDVLEYKLNVEALGSDGQ